MGAADDGVAGPKRALLDNDGRERAAADVHLGLDDDARDLGLRVRLQFKDVRLQKDHLQEVVDAGPLGRGDGNRDGFPAPVLRDDSALLHLRLHLVDIRALHVHLVHRDDDDHLCGPRVLEGLVRLRHETVVRRNHEDGDVGHRGTARPHLVERGVARRVEERDLS